MRERRGQTEWFHLCVYTWCVWYAAVPPNFCTDFGSLSLFPMLLLPYIYIAVEALDDDGEFLDNKVEYVEDLQEIMEGGEYNIYYLCLLKKTSM